MLKTAFSRFKNTPDDPVILDEDDGNSVPPANDDVEVVEIYNHSMPVEVPVDSTTETEVEQSGKEGKLENQPIPMNGVVDSSTLTEADLKMNDRECIDEDKSAVELSEVYLDSWERDSLTDTQCLLISTGNENTFVGGLGSDKATTSGKGRKRKGSSKRVDTKRGAANHETKANEHMPTMMKEGSSSLLKKRERTELEDGGFGLLPLTDIIRKRNCTTQSNVSKGEDISGNQQEHESSETMDNLFNSTASGERTPNTTKKTGLVNECMDIVLSQHVDDPLAEQWESPTFVAQVGESMRVSEENSKAMKFMNIIEPPGFDLGISPEKDVQTEKTSVVGPSGSGVTKDKGKGKLFDDNHASEESGFIRGITERRFHEVVSNIVVSDSSEQLFEEKKCQKGNSQDEIGTRSDR
ncbi:hypothetical protein L6452_36749 [Arctium lappa]|uniref:Uncharacterized protein n=1 Tax=Arctium lappa TaxID=4217 RepID=A0ACB8Y162_ARCLA|nr:hypothetical protein L6452_36749 [Arctium lappa]